MEPSSASAAATSTPVRCTTSCSDHAAPGPTTKSTRTRLTPFVTNAAVDMASRRHLQQSSSGDSPPPPPPATPPGPSLPGTPSVPGNSISPSASAPPASPPAPPALAAPADLGRSAAEAVLLARFATLPPNLLQLKLLLLAPPGQSSGTLSPSTPPGAHPMNAENLLRVAIHSCLSAMCGVSPASPSGQ